MNRRKFFFGLGIGLGSLKQLLFKVPEECVPGLTHICSTQAPPLSGQAFQSPFEIHPMHGGFGDPQGIGMVPTRVIERIGLNTYQTRGPEGEVRFIVKADVTSRERRDDEPPQVIFFA